MSPARLLPPVPFDRADIIEKAADELGILPGVPDPLTGVRGSVAGWCDWRIPVFLAGSNCPDHSRYAGQFTRCEDQPWEVARNTAVYNVPPIPDERNKNDHASSA